MVQGNANGEIGSIRFEREREGRINVAKDWVRFHGGIQGFKRGMGLYRPLEHCVYTGHFGEGLGYSGKMFYESAIVVREA